MPFLGSPSIKVLFNKHFPAITIVQAIYSTWHSLVFIEQGYHSLTSDQTGSGSFRPDMIANVTEIITEIFANGTRFKWNQFKNCNLKLWLSRGFDVSFIYFTKFKSLVCITRSSWELLRLYDTWQINGSSYLQRFCKYLLAVISKLPCNVLVMHGLQGFLQWII